MEEFFDKLYRSESGRILATLVRLLGDLDLAEDALHDAFQAALEQWPTQGMPANTTAWLISAGRFKAIDRMRRSARTSTPLDNLEPLREPQAETALDHADQAIRDDHLRLIFTCCHPALPAEARAALTLREVCALTTEEIASAFLTSPPTVAQRIVRAKSKLKDEGIPFELPSAAELPQRLAAVLQVIYLVFNEGYSASAGDRVTRPDLSGEAIRLGRLLLEILPEPEVMGLLALMLLHESRRTARTARDGRLIILEQQDRKLWDRSLIKEGAGLVEKALASRRFGPYTLQAAISALHSEAADVERTDWAEIVSLYDLLTRMEPSPVLELNRAVAIAMRDGPAAGLKLVDGLLARRELRDYHLAYSVRADLCRRLGKVAEAKTAYKKAISLARLEPERRFLQSRLQELP